MAPAQGKPANAALLKEIRRLSKEIACDMNTEEAGPETRSAAEQFDQVRAAVEALATMLDYLAAIVEEHE